nr:immunoglobulin light chain junction region [Macaca mulatta]MOW08334.1 immunoglobulin light chain junction region [Macaca mulatta]MOW08467.1 immunoglobulin light chain junction region [Macaca mulatta]MOW08677.1 immunoglobulin light chain junction region [Macaca mulatta]MOW08683.1 immunoglobulin light chain junction region [Macaca mulatta]
CQQHDTSPYNF